VRHIRSDASKDLPQPRPLTLTFNRFARAMTPSIGPAIAQLIQFSSLWPLGSVSESGSAWSMSSCVGGRPAQQRGYQHPWPAVCPCLERKPRGRLVIARAPPRPTWIDPSLGVARTEAAQVAKVTI
jgi:hypothetical protein